MDFNIGGSLGRFGPPRGHTEQRIESPAEIDAACRQTLDAIQQWGLPLLTEFETPQAAALHFDQGDYFGVTGWQDVIAIYAIVNGPAEAARKSAHLPDTLLLTGSRRAVTPVEIARRLCELPTDAYYWTPK